MELAELAAKFNMTLGEAKAALNESNIYPFTSNPKVEGEKLEQYKRVLAKKAGISVPSHTTGIATNNTRIHTPTHRSAPSTRSGRELSNQDAEQNQKEMLSRDFVIFTHMALRKPVTSEILRQAVEYKLMDNTRTQIVICSGTIRDVQDSAKDFAKLEGTVKALDLLKQHRMLTILQGPISAENHNISTFLKEKVKPEQTVLIVGYNRSLSTYVNFRNSSNKNNPSYPFILEKDVWQIPATK